MKTQNGWQDLETKPTAKFLANGLIKYFDSFGNYVRIGFKFKNASVILKKDGYNVVRGNNNNNNN